MNIAVHDKDESVLAMIRNYFKKHDIMGVNKSIDYFLSAEAMLLSLKDRAYDIFLLGEGIKGIQGAGYILYIRRTNNKIISFEEFRKGLSKVKRIHAAEEEYYIDYFNKERVVLKIGEIQYFELVQREIFVHGSGKPQRVSGFLYEKEGMLPKHLFARISQGVLVNLKYVKQIEGENVYLSTGEVKYASVRRALQALEKWEYYLMFYNL